MHTHHTHHSSCTASPSGRQLQHTIFFWRAQLSQKYTHTNWYTKFGSSSEKGWLIQCCCWITNPRWQKSNNLTLQANSQDYACTEYVCKPRPFYDINSFRSMHNSPVNIISGCTYINIHSDNGPAYPVTLPISNGYNKHNVFMGIQNKSCGRGKVETVLRLGSPGG